MLAVARLDRSAARSDDGRMDESEDRAQALHLKLASRRDSRRRVPEELRAEAVAKTEYASGKHYKSIASALGVKAETLMRWCRRSGEPKKFAHVVVKRAARPQLTVHGPSGTRIEELSIQQVAELLRALSCSG